MPGVRNDVPTFATYLSRYDVQHIPASPAILNSTTVTSSRLFFSREFSFLIAFFSLERVRVPKQTRRTSTTSSVVNSYVSSDIPQTTMSRSSSVSFDNPSIDGLSLNDEHSIPNATNRTNDSPLPLAGTTPGLSSSLSELDPMLNNRPRTPSPIPALIPIEQAMTVSSDDKSTLTEVTDNSQSSIVETQSPVNIEESVKLPEEQLQISGSVEESMRMSEKMEDSIQLSEKPEYSTLSSPSMSIDHGLSDLSVERKNDDLLQITQVDTLDLP